MHVIGSEGFVFPEDSEEALRNILQKLKNEPGECKRLADAGRKRVLGEFTWDVLADKAHRLYEDILRS